jgi:hypothetical protein
LMAALFAAPGLSSKINRTLTAEYGDHLRHHRYGKKGLQLRSRVLESEPK